MFLLLMLFLKHPISKEKMFMVRKSAGKLRNLGHVKKLRNIHNKAFI